MRRWFGLLLVSVLGVLAASCASKDAAPFIEPPDMMEQLSNADLRAPAPMQLNHTPARFAGAGETVVESYPGDDAAESADTNPKVSGVTQKRGGYDLNFSEADLSDLTKVILQDTLSIPYIYDPRVQGRVTVSTGGPVSRDELLTLLETVLAMNRAALIVEGNVYRIVPDIEGRPEVTTSFNYARERQEVGPGYGVSIVPLKYVSADTMRRILTSLGARTAGVRASVINNLLVIRGTGRERQSLLEITMTFDVDWMKGQSAGLFTLANASPDEIITSLQEVFQAEEKGKGLVRFQPITRLNAILVLTQKLELLDKAEEWITRLDRETTEGDDYYVYRIEHGKAKDLAQVLTASFTGAGGGVTRAAEESSVAPNRAASRTTSAPASDQAATSSETTSSFESATTTESSTSTASTELSSVSHFASNSSGGGAGEVRITPNENDNTLLIKAPAREYRKILSILRRIDRPALQVLINATLAEVTLNDNLKYGVQFYLQRRGGLGGALGFTSGSQIEISPPVPGLNFIVGSVTDPKVIIDALATETAVRVVSSPSIVVEHNQQATLQVGDEVPISTRQASSVIDPDAPLVNEIQFKNTGVILKVTPRISSGGLVSMEIEQELSAVANSVATGSDGTLTPTISQRRVSSSIAVQSGQMVVLGGLISERLDDSKSRIPVLRKIPYLGDILGGQTDATKARAELIMFLRPTVIRNPEEAGQIAEAVRASMQSMAPRPTAWDSKVMPQGNGGMK